MSYFRLFRVDLWAVEWRSDGGGPTYCKFFLLFLFLGKRHTSLIELHHVNSNVISTNAGQSDYLLPLVPISTLFSTEAAHPRSIHRYHLVDRRIAPQ